jgi:hypothetical protein
MMDLDTEIVRLSYKDGEAVWEEWAPDVEDILARAAFERTLRFAAGIEDEGLYFRPGGWTVDLPATVARIACAAAILAAAFQIAGLEDVDREIIIAAAGLVATMDVRPVRLTRKDQTVVKRIRDKGLEGVTVSPAGAWNTLPRRLRERVSEDDVADVLDRVVAAGLADCEGADGYVLRAARGGAWIRISLRTGGAPPS